MKQVYRPLVLALILGSVAVAAPASADHGGIHPTFKPSTVYFHCNGTTKLYQANFTTDPILFGSDAAAGWNASPPSQSVLDGGGCGGTDFGWVVNEIADPVFHGTFRGNLRDMTVRIYDFILANTRESADQRMWVYAEVDGVPIFPKGLTEGSYDGRKFLVTPERLNEGATDFYEFSITNIGYAIDILDADGKVIDVDTGGVAFEDGDGTEEHDFRMLLGIDGFPGEDPPAGSNFWVWDTTEVPSGITFNPTNLASATVAADLPDFG